MADRFEPDGRQAFAGLMARTAGEGEGIAMTIQEHNGERLMRFADRKPRKRLTKAQRIARKAVRTRRRNERAPVSATLTGAEVRELRRCYRVIGKILRKIGRTASEDRRGSNIDRVLSAIAVRPRTVSQICKATGLEDDQVRGVLNSPTIANRIRRTRINRRMNYATDRPAGQKGGKSGNAD